MMKLKLVLEALKGEKVRYQEGNVEVIGIVNRTKLDVPVRRKGVYYIDFYSEYIFIVDGEEVRYPLREVHKLGIVSWDSENEELNGTYSNMVEYLFKEMKENAKVILSRFKEDVIEYRDIECEIIKVRGKYN